MNNESGKTEPIPTGSTKGGERVKELKRDIALNHYEVDAGAVADAILAKLRMVKRCRDAIAVQADQTPKPSQPTRRLH
jgi:hypothetical protein